MTDDVYQKASIYIFDVLVIEVFLFRCNIDWKKGKNVTQKTIKKKQKHKGNSVFLIVPVKLCVFALYK